MDSPLAVIVVKAKVECVGGKQYGSVGKRARLMCIIETKASGSFLALLWNGAQAFLHEY